MLAGLCLGMAVAGDSGVGVVKGLDDKNRFNLMDMCKAVDKKLGYDQRECGKHFYPDTGDFDDWCDLNSKGEYDEEGKHRNSSQSWFMEYNKDIIIGKWKDTPYLDFWHWQIDNCVPDTFCNDSYSTIYVGMDRDFKSEWQREIQRVWHEMFYGYSKDGYVDAWVCW